MNIKRLAAMAVVMLLTDIGIAIMLDPHNPHFYAACIPFNLAIFFVANIRKD